MKRQIIKIDEEKCTGCGDCISSCPEGAIQLVDGKAKLVSETFCDGLGACIGDCPEGAISVITKEAEVYDEEKVIRNIIPKGKETILAHLKHLEEHKQISDLKIALKILQEENINVGFQIKKAPMPTGGCPGMRAKSWEEDRKPSSPTSNVNTSSELRQWPIQLKLLHPMAPYLKNANLLIAADCVPFTFPNFHEKFLKGKRLVTFCPKLDQANDLYVEKLKEILEYNDIQSISVVRMEVPCCGGTLRFIEEALRQSGKIVPIRDYVISIQGDII